MYSWRIDFPVRQYARVKQLVLIALAGAIFAYATEIPSNTCIRPPAGSAVPEPEDFRSRDGVLKVDLTIHDYSDANICNPFQYDTSIMANAAVRTAHIQDLANLYTDIQNGTLPAVSFTQAQRTGGRPSVIVETESL